MEPNLPNLQYKVLPLARTKVRVQDEVTTATASAKLIKDCQVQFNGKWHGTTPRFWTSFFARFGFSSSIFRYFAHQEVFDRVCQKHADVELRFCIEEDGESRRLLAVSSPGKPLITPEQYAEVARTSGMEASSTRYSCGILRSTHTPASGQQKHQIGGDDFRNQFVLDVPLDGYGDPSIHLALLREVCSNGMVARTSVFKSDLKVGDDPVYNIRRALSTFDSDDGFGALQQRFRASQDSPASLRECLGLFKRLRAYGEVEHIKAYEKAIGDIYGHYGVANLDAFSEKKLRLLPAKCKVYDLLNLASEIATHGATPDQALSLNGWIGTTVCEEYDLEGTGNKHGDFQDVFLPKKDGKGAKPN